MPCTPISCAAITPGHPPSMLAASRGQHWYQGCNRTTEQQTRDRSHLPQRKTQALTLEPAPAGSMDAAWLYAPNRGHSCMQHYLEQGQPSALPCPTIPQQGCLPWPQLCCSSKVHISSWKRGSHRAAACSMGAAAGPLTSHLPSASWHTALCSLGVSAELGQLKPRAPAQLLTQQQPCSAAQWGCAHCKVPPDGCTPHSLIAGFPSCLLLFSAPEQGSKKEPRLPPELLLLC